MIASKGSKNIACQNKPALIFCFIITLLVITGALISSKPFVLSVIRPLYLGVMLGFFWIMGIIEPGLKTQGWRFLLIGLFLLFAGSFCGALVESMAIPGMSRSSARSLAWSLQQGVGFLLGFSTLSFGFVLWIPEIVQSKKILEQGLETVSREHERTAKKLRRSMRALDRAHDHLIQAERIAAVGELAAGIAHDLRNPLAIIKSAAQGICDTGEGKEHLEMTAQVIQRGVEKADRTIRALLEMGKPAAFEPSLHRAENLISETVELARIPAGKKEIALIRGAPCVNDFWGDYGLLAQALLNLALNAIQATPKGGVIRIGCRTFHLGNNNQLVFFMEDTGQGIPMDIRTKIFTPFFTTRDEGTGLGLAVTQRIAARHGGRLDLKPRNRGGTRALLILPAASRKSSKLTPL